MEGRGCVTPRIVLARRLVANDEEVRLCAVQEPERDSREGGMEQRALSLHELPMVLGRVRRYPLDRAGDEVRRHRVDRHATPRDQHAGLACSAEFSIVAAPPHLRFERQRGVFLADRAIRADGQDAPSRRAGCLCRWRRRGLAWRTSCS